MYMAHGHGCTPLSFTVGTPMLGLASGTAQQGQTSAMCFAHVAQAAQHWCCSARATCIAVHSALPFAPGSMATCMRTCWYSAHMNQHMYSACKCVCETWHPLHVLEVMLAFPTWLHHNNGTPIPVINVSRGGSAYYPIAWSACFPDLHHILAYCTCNHCVQILPGPKVGRCSRG